MSGFNGSPEHEDWIDSGARDEEYEHYYNKWDLRVSTQSIRKKYDE